MSKSTCAEFDGEEVFRHHMMIMSDREILGEVLCPAMTTFEAMALVDTWRVNEIATQSIQRSGDESGGARGPGQWSLLEPNSAVS